MTPVAWNGKTAALTGTTGFVGGHVLDVLLERGWHVRALSRRPMPPRMGVEWIHGSLTHISALEALTKNADSVIHVAGLTKALGRSQFFDVNLEGTDRLLQAAERSGAKHFVQVSSLSAREPALSHYGASKAAGDLLVSGRPRKLPWIILRPGGVYGPGDHEILKILQVSKKGILPALGSRRNRFSMIYARDLAETLVNAAEHPDINGTFEVDDGHLGGYKIDDIRDALNVSVPIITLPYPVLWTAGVINGWIARLMNQPRMLTRTTARYLCHRDWAVIPSRRPPAEIWSPSRDIHEGMAATIDWYRKNELL